MNRYFPPQYSVSSFTCPKCHTKAHMNWTGIFAQNLHVVHDLKYCECTHCNEYSLWLAHSVDSIREFSDWRMVFPLIASSPRPNEDMPDAIKLVYEEARQVEPHSKRAAAALLRLCTEQLLKHLGYYEKFFHAIGTAAADGLPDEVIQGFDILRLYGNDALHPVAEIKMDEIGEDVPYLFELLNEIVEVTITRKKKRDALLGKMPERKLKDIDVRNEKAKESK